LRISGDRMVFVLGELCFVLLKAEIVVDTPENGDIQLAQKQLHIFCSVNFINCFKSALKNMKGKGWKQERKHVVVSFVIDKTLCSFNSINNDFIIYELCNINELSLYRTCLD
jgi:hypothetical protein